MMKMIWNMTDAICANNGHVKCALREYDPGMKVGWYVIVVGKGKGETMKEEQIRKIVRKLSHEVQEATQTEIVIMTEEWAENQLAELFERECYELNRQKEFLRSNLNEYKRLLDKADKQIAGLKAERSYNIERRVQAEADYKAIKLKYETAQQMHRGMREEIAKLKKELR